MITHKDRLLGFGAELFFAICAVERRGGRSIILNKGEESSLEKDLAKDVLEIITVFSVRLYGSRLCKNRKLLENVRYAVCETEKEIMKEAA